MDGTFDGHEVNLVLAGPNGVGKNVSSGTPILALCLLLRDSFPPSQCWLIRSQ